MVHSIFQTAYWSLTLLFLTGMGLYLLDRQSWWQATYRWVHDFFHSAKHAMPKDKTRGVFYNQPSATKWTRVGLASTILFVVSIWEAKLSVNLLAEVIVWMLGIPTMLLGIYVGYQAQERLFPNRERLFRSADRLSEQLEHASLAGAAGAVKDLGANMLSGIRSSSSQDSKSADEPANPPPPKAAEEDPRTALKRLLGS
jgi:hypothetical protein